MKLKKIMANILVLIVPQMGLASVAIVFNNEKAVSMGSFYLGTVTPSGIIVSAKEALGSGSPMVGWKGQPLATTSILRLDSQLNIAILKLEKVVQNQEIQMAFEKKLSQLIDFFPKSDSGSDPATPHLIISDTGPLKAEIDAPFLIKINGQDTENRPVFIIKKRDKAELILEVESNYPDKLWRLDVNVASDPYLLFWKKGQNKSLNKIPERTFNYFYTAMFKPIKKGKSIRIPLEVSSIKMQEYEWTVKINSKKEVVYDKKFQIRFNEKSKE